MNNKLDNALYMLESAGYTVKTLKESSTNLVDTIKSKYEAWEKVRGTPEADDLWDELEGEYGMDMVRFVVNSYDIIKAGEAVDMTSYLADADALYPEFFDMLKKVGVTRFTINTQKAFGGNAFYFFRTAAEGFASDRIQLRLDKYDFHNPEYAYFTIKN